jgi:hypothetical protein
MEEEHRRAWVPSHAVSLSRSQAGDGVTCEDRIRVDFVNVR